MVLFVEYTKIWIDVFKGYERLLVFRYDLDLANFQTGYFLYYENFLKIRRIGLSFTFIILTFYLHVDQKEIPNSHYSVDKNNVFFSLVHNITFVLCHLNPIKNIVSSTRINKSL